MNSIRMKFQVWIEQLECRNLMHFPKLKSNAKFCRCSTQSVDTIQNTLREYQEIGNVVVYFGYSVYSRFQGYSERSIANGIDRI
ncbi:hypothetical protein C0J52_27397 [Blattella germanica]|nr:hypothetical protein C0J52_27397 [Blattella germanica]